MNSDATGKLQKAIHEWRTQLGEDAVLIGARVTAEYGPSTIGIKRNIPAALIPGTTDDIITIVRIANKHRQPVYPISTGNNWGYGSANPVIDNCVIVDLSRMDRILEMDTERGLVTVEPGVTQSQLHRYLEERQLPYMVPTTGAGPNCSLIGNALERGYGITPIADHFLAVMSLEAILPDGQIYRTPLTELGSGDVDRSFKWGIGPYLDGLFTQGNLGIVTQMSIALAPTPENTYGLIFSVEDDTKLGHIVTILRDILRTVGMHTSSINLMNTRRVLSMIESYPSELVPAGEIIPEHVIASMARKHQIKAWTGVGAVYGSGEMYKAVKRMIRRRLKPYATRIQFISPGTARIARQVLSLIPLDLARRLAFQAGKFEASLDLLSGKPSSIALPLAYWKSESPLEDKDEDKLNPARDGCGLIWYSPLVPMMADKVQLYVDLVTKVCTQYGIEPLITLTTLSPYCFDSTVPILFNPNDANETEQAQLCFEALFQAGKKAGFLPYRVGVNSMDSIIETSQPFWQMVGQIKGAIDPNGILAPGRYSPRN